ncbi:L-aspartate oxidase [Spirochaetia bacterium 38H-sp]|uniref:L-aspartate oxidase n=1 Tax=Rarispira pelagica TaxID=3141764 RepID=A0ABU9UE22_9SPIR
MITHRMYVDVLVLGSGLAGLSAAISAADEGLDVLVVSKESELKECNTFYAQGGIVFSGEGDSPDLLARDIEQAGAGVCFSDAVRLVAEEGPSLVKRYLIDDVGVEFDVSREGFDFTREGAHSIRRILHVHDETGRAIELSFLRRVTDHQRISLAAGYTAIDLITNSHNSSNPEELYRPTRVMGAYLLDSSGNVLIVFAAAVVLATGGVGNLFLNTSNPPGATGDGVAMAYRAGVPIINAHYIQFHPTVLFHRDLKRLLITEAFRGEGARLLNHSGEYFMERYSPDKKDLAPRDEVSRAIYAEMEAEGSDFVFLDARNLDVDIKDRFSNIYAKCLEVGLDITKDPIPVVPAAHYFCGGVKTDLSGATIIPGLYAVGECACNGVHGANRLASVSLLEALVFGIRAGKDIASRAKKPSKLLMSEIRDWIYPAKEEFFDPVLIESDLKYLRVLMWNYVGIVRTRKRLERAMSDIHYLKQRIEQFYKSAEVRKDIVELRNAVLVAEIITRTAYANPSSIGCHYIKTD